MKAFLSTGEAAAILGISRSTVSRKFDQGVLEGKKNPITGERMISRESVQHVLEEHDLPTPKVGVFSKRLSVVSQDKAFKRMVRTTLEGTPGVEVEYFSFGTDALVWCSQNQTDLLIVDDSIQDVSPEELIRSIQRWKEIPQPKLRYLHSGETPIASAVDKEIVWRKDALDTASLARTLYETLGIGRNHSKKARTWEGNRRAAPRYLVHLPAQLSVYKVSAPKEAETGQAVVKNISVGGVLLADIRTGKGVLPAEAFRIRVHVDERELPDWHADCHVIRLHSNGSLSAGLQFMPLSGPNQKKIQTFLERLEGSGQAG